LRFFTAEGELPACGHGTVAALAQLAGGAADRFTLRTANSERIPARTRAQGGLVAAEFEAGRVALRAPSAAELAPVLAALGLPAVSQAAQVATLGRPRLLLAVADRVQLASLTPDFEALRAACQHLDLLGCYLFTTAVDDQGHRAARMFAPAIGVPEDIANANSTACLAAWLQAIDPDRRGVAVDMGDHLGSPATITATAGAGSLVSVGGLARVGRTVQLDLPG
jgi:PhzF family phenazine biosynthesis protein